MDEENILLTAEESGERIDALLSRSIEGLTRNAAQRLIESGLVTVRTAQSSSSDSLTLPVNIEFRPIKKNHRCTAGEVFSVILPTAADTPIVAQNIPIDVVYEDSSVIVVDKPRGMVVHPAPGHPDGTLVNALLYHCGDSLSGIGGEKRPGIVHRIDMDTSGLLIAAKNDKAHAFLSAQLSDRSLSRVYMAVANGSFREDEGTVDRPIGRHPVDRKRMAVTDKNSRPAVTHWKVEKRYKGYALVQCRLETGRTHQIRVHMASIGHPLLGDGLYGAKSPDKGLTGQCLHAFSIKFIHPDTLEPMSFSVSLPDYFTDVLSRLGPEI